MLAYMMTVSSKGARAPPQPSCPDEPNGQPKKDNGNWPSASMTFDQFSYLADLDTDVVEQPEVDAIARYADLWLRSKVLNQPIRMKSNFGVKFVYGSFHDAEVACTRSKVVPGSNEKAKLNSPQREERRQ
ncbi:MAG TPA: hypothetical protein VI358_15130 [Pseudolabrys sp.]